MSKWLKTYQRRLNKIKRYLVQCRLTPIRVFCLHHVTKVFDAESMNECDWTNLDVFKQIVTDMQRNGVEFISLSEAQTKLANDIFRCRKYAILVFDDGYASLKEVLPWLEEQKIPVTLFINGKYLDGRSYRENPKERYLTKDELWELNSPLIEIGSHGWEHISAVLMTESEFEDSSKRNIELLQRHPRYIPFHAYTYGRHNETNDKSLREIGLIPVLIDGQKNYNNPMVIHRELLIQS